MRIEEVAARTPPTRDRYVDFLRAFSILVVVLGHWLIALIWWEDGRIGVRNVIGVTRGLWLATWLLQVMPLFFFVGGFSNLKTYESMRARGERISTYWRTRYERLMAPTWIFVGIWLAIQAIMHLADVGGSGIVRGGLLPFGPLWFLLVYFGVIFLAPVAIALHRRFRLWIPVALLAIVVVADLLRFGAGVPKIGWINLGAVWLLAHQLGFFYADGDLVKIGRRGQLTLALVGLAGLIVLTNIGVYPRSMIGTDVEVVSNMNPPTLCIVALTLWQVGLAMLLRDPFERWLQKQRAWTAVIAANSMIMTLFLWHMTAYVVAIVLLWPLGLGRLQLSTAAWWAQRPVWVIVPGLILAVLVATFGRFERPPSRGGIRATRRRAGS